MKYRLPKYEDIDILKDYVEEHYSNYERNISASNCLKNWVSGVANSGTFIKNTNMTSLPNGASGIPTGWTVQDYSA